MKKFLILCELAVFSICAYAKDGFSFYNDGGKWGVLYNNETCLLPRFDEVSLNEFHYGVFFYKENEKDKWGVANLWRIITPAQYDSISFITYSGGLGKYNNRITGIIDKTVSPKIQESAISNSLYHYTNIKNNFFYLKIFINGKCGIYLVDGTEVISPVYDDVFSNFFNDKSFGIEAKVPDMKCNHYFLVREKGECKLIDLFSREDLMPINFDFNIFLDKEVLKKTGKQLKKELNKRKKDFSLDTKSILDGILAINNLYVLFRDPVKCSLSDSYRIFKSDLNIYFNFPFLSEKYDKKKVKSILEELENNQLQLIKPLNDVEEYVGKYQEKPRSVYLGYKNGEYINCTGESMSIDGFDAVVTPFGFISMPLVYDAPTYRLERNPFDLRATMKILSSVEAVNRAEYLGDPRYIELLENKVSLYEQLIAIAEQSGDQNELIMCKLGSQYSKNRLMEYKKEVKDAQDLAKFTEKVNSISSIMTSVFNCGASIAGAFQNGAQASGTISDKNSRSSHLNNGNNLSLSDMTNYQSLRNTYMKWANDLMQMKNANGQYSNGYSQSDKKHAQNEMKRIRQTAKSKFGKEIPYNSLEDWN